MALVPRPGRNARFVLFTVLLAMLPFAALACSSSNNSSNNKPTNTGATTVATRAGTAAAVGSPVAGQLPPGGKDDPQSITMAFVPSRDVSVIQLSADKIAAYLTKQLGRPVRSVTLTSYAAVAQALTAKTADLAWVGPLDYLISHEVNGAYPITCSVRGGALGYKAFIIARKDSSINTVADLKGKSVALGDVVSASSSLVPRGAMIKAGLNPDKDIKSVNISNQSAIALAVYEGKADAGAIYDDARTNKEVTDKYPDILDKTKIIYTSDLIPCDPQIVRKDLTSDLAKKMQTALLNLSNDPDGKTWINDLFSISSLAPASDALYDGLRQIVKAVQPDLLKGYPAPATPVPTPKP